MPGAARKLRQHRPQNATLATTDEAATPFPLLATTAGQRELRTTTSKSKKAAEHLPPQVPLPLPLATKAGRKQKREKVADHLPPHDPLPLPLATKAGQKQKREMKRTDDKNQRARALIEGGGRAATSALQLPPWKLREEDPHPKPGATLMRRSYSPQAGLIEGDLRRPHSLPQNGKEGHQHAQDLAVKIPSSTPRRHGGRTPKPTIYSTAQASPPIPTHSGRATGGKGEGRWPATLRSGEEEEKRREEEEERRAGGLKPSRGLCSTA